MNKNRSFWLVLLIPFLLDLLIVFADRPGGGDFQSRIGEESAEVLKDFCEYEERMEEEEDISAFGLFRDFRSALDSPSAYGRCHFFSIVSSACPLASGWMMPLRI